MCLLSPSPFLPSSLPSSLPSFLPPSPIGPCHLPVIIIVSSLLLSSPCSVDSFQTFPLAHTAEPHHVTSHHALRLSEGHHITSCASGASLFLSLPFLSSSAPSLIFFLYVIHEYYLAKLAKSLEGPEGCLEAPALLLVCAPKVEGSACGLAVPEEPVPDRNRDLRFP